MIEVERLEPRLRFSDIKPWGERLIGCPIWWLQRVSPLIEGKQELIAALYVWRRHAVVGKQTFSIANDELKLLGVDRRAKYQMLAKLEAAGMISVSRKGNAAPLVTILPSTPKRQCHSSARRLPTEVG